MSDEKKTSHQEPTSSPCGAHEADPAYMGFLPREELIGELQVLLEAERAGARVARESSIEAAERDTARVEGLEALLDDEVHCCKVLLECLERLGATPSQKIGDFYDKCMAIDDLEARLALVDKGQRWVLRKVEAILPRLQDAGMIAAMKDVRDRHV